MVSPRKSPQFDRCQNPACGEQFTGTWRSDKAYCDDACRLAASKQRRGLPAGRRGAHWQAEIVQPLGHKLGDLQRFTDLERERFWHEKWPDKFDEAEKNRVSDEFQRVYENAPCFRPMPEDFMPKCDPSKRAEAWAKVQYELAVDFARERFHREMVARGPKYQAWDGTVRKWPADWQRDPSRVPPPEPFPPLSGEKVTMEHFTKDFPGGITASIVVPVESVWAYERTGWRAV